MRKLKNIGLSIAIDDFGIGYSSLSYLKRFPVDRLKIDRSFVSGVSDSRQDAAIVAAIISVAHSLGIDVVAEGVETVEQLDFLSAHGCEHAQGYLFSKPVVPEEISMLLQNPQLQMH
jgi:EAL domain-containing protein (putative c-di-GMP-specific phosphodiesterase class I)